MSNVLSSKDFGLKIYNRFPPKYREDDENNNLALKRYLMALADGGFKTCIDEINGLTALIDPDSVEAKLLPIMFQQYGLEIFNGIPEEYLRFLLPRLGEVWSRKGSLSVVEFITSSLSGIKTSTDIEYDEKDNPEIKVRLELDEGAVKYYPSSEQLKRVLNNFVPFFCDLDVKYSSMFYEGFELSDRKLVGHISDTTTITDIKDEKGVIVRDEMETFKETLVTKPYEESLSLVTSKDINCITNSGLSVLNTGFYTNTLTSYSIITIPGKNNSTFGESVFGEFVFGDSDSRELFID